MLYHSPMSKYASVLFGADTYEKIGPFRFPIWKELNPGEFKGFERIQKDQARATFKSIKLAQRIAQERGITTQAALDILSELNKEENQDLVYVYAEELNDIQESNLSEFALKLEYITCFMKFRGEVKMPGSRDYVQTKDWTSDDTDKTPREYLDKIYELLVKERDGWDVKEKKTEEETES